MSGGKVTKAKIPATKKAKKKAKKIVAQQVTTLPASWVGIDRHSLPVNPTSNEPGWLGSLIDRSNFRFTGAYIQGDPLIESFGNPPHQSSAGDFKYETYYDPNKPVKDRKWMQNLGHLHDQGWGIVFWYFGLSELSRHINSKPPKPSEWPAVLVTANDAAVYGRLHARHAKSAVQAAIQTTNTQLAGSVVFLDNEDGSSKPTKLIKAYCEAFFDEIEKPGPNMAPAMRCGLYAQSYFAEAFVQTRKDLFVWEIRLDSMTDSAGLTDEAPFEATSNPLFVDPTWTQDPTPKGRGERNIHSFEIQYSTADKWTAWPLGRQFRFYSKSMPIAGTPVVDTLSHFTPMSVFDYDSSLVRDPSYPVAEPRIAAATDNIVVAGAFVARTVGGADPPRMKIESIESGGRTPIAGPVTRFVEPDAPIALAAFSGEPTQFMTVLTTGDLAAFSRDPSGVLSPINAIALTPASGLRRLRAIALVSYDANDLALFFAGQDHQLYTSRSQSPGVWDITSLAGSLLALHPFSSLAAASRSGQSVDVFALDTQGLLWASSWSPAPGTWQCVQLDTAAPSLLKGGALAATSPDPQKLFVFGIRSDLRLGYWEWTGPDGGWSAPIPLAETTARLSPHSRLAAHSYPGVVEIVGLSHDGILRLYSLKLTGTTWTAQTPILYANPDDAPPEGYVPPSPSSPTEPAYGWSINPYGDLAIARETNGTVVYAAGIAPGRSGLLSLNLTIGGSTWELLR